MTVSAAYAPDVYAGNGVTWIFPFTFKILASTHLVVTKTSAMGVVTTLGVGVNYTLDWNGAGLTGSVRVVTFVGEVATSAPPIAGETITLTRVVPILQETDLRAQGKISAESLEQALDKLTMINQHIRLDSAMTWDARLSNSRTPTAHVSTHTPNGTDAIPWTTVHGRGLAENRPDASAGNEGYIYYSSDTLTLERSTGSAWEPIGGGGGGGGGTWGTIAGTLSAQADLAGALSGLGARLNALEYIAPDVSGLSNTVGTVEIGSTVTSVTLNWALNKVMTTESIAAPGPGSITPPTLLTYTIGSLALTAQQAFTVTVGDGTNTDAATTTVYFQHRRRWGVSATGTPDSALIDALAGAEFATGRSQSRSMSPSGQYLYFAWPAAWGTPSFTVNGLPVSGWAQTTISYTNPSGNTTGFDVWRSQYLQTGTFSVVVS